MVKKRGNLVEMGLSRTVSNIAEDILNAGRTNNNSIVEEAVSVVEVPEAHSIKTDEIEVLTSEQKQTEHEEKEEQNEDAQLSNVFRVEKKETFDKKQKMYYLKLDNIAWVKKMAKKLNRSESDFIDIIIDNLKNSIK